MAGGKRFAGDFQRIDAVKPNDKMLIQDSADGNVKFAFPGQITTINGWKTVESVEELPLNPMRKDIAYVVGDDMYFWVGTGGDTLGGVYQKANIFKGGDGETPHIHFAYANSADGYNDFSMTESANRAYMGIYADYAEEGSTDPTRYTWVRIQGAQGTPSYVHVAYAESADGSVGFSLTDSLNKPYLGIYVDSTKGALDDPAVYKWTLIKGSRGLNSYVHIAYANSADGEQDFSTTVAEGKSYLGTYVDTNPQASSNPSDYAWMLTKGEQGESGDEVNRALNVKLEYTAVELTMSGMWSSQPFGQTVNTSNAKRTEILPLNGFNKLSVRGYMGASGALVTFFNANKVALPEISIAGAGGKWQTADINLLAQEYADAKYFAVSNYGGGAGYDGFYTYLYTQDSIADNVEQLLVASPFGNINKLKILIFGDSQLDCTAISITQDETSSYNILENNVQQGGKYYSMWPVILQKYINCSDLRCYAQTGASYKTSTRQEGKERQNLSYQIDLALNDAPNPNGVFPTNGEFTPDIIIFSLGVNDGEPNDTFSDAMAKTVLDASGDIDVAATIANLSMTKFCEAARASFLRIKEKWPASLVFCTLPAQNAMRDQATDGVNIELKKMAERYSMIVIDLASEMGVVQDFEKKNAAGVLLKDGLHYNSIAQSLAARLIAARIKANYINMRYANGTAMSYFK